MDFPILNSFDLDSIPIVFEDEWLLIVSKPAGLSVHVNPTDKGEPNLQDLLSEGRKRPLTLFHRLDKDTSGLVILGKKPVANAPMTQLFEEKRIRKAYYAIVEGEWPKKLNRIESRLARGANGKMVVSDRGQDAVTTFRVLLSQTSMSLIEAMPKTGRTHQIRVHCASKGFPILGDRLYGEAGPTLALHAHRLDFRHPFTKNSLTIRAPLPSNWKSEFQGFAFEALK